VHFGLVESQGGGKFICHVFAEYKVSKLTSKLRSMLSLSCIIPRIPIGTFASVYKYNDEF
jgi:hypothetical protein